MLGRKKFCGYTYVTLIDNDGDRYSSNAHSYEHDAHWYDWAYAYYEIEEDGECKVMHYPSKNLGFLQDREDFNVIVQCVIDPVPWPRLEEEFIVKFSLNMDVGEEQIVPMSSLVHPICVVSDFRVENKNGHVMILPKGQWSDYFARFIKNGINSL